VAAGGVEQAADAPDHVGHGTVDEQRPEGKKDGHGAELHALGKGAGDERRGDDGEHELVDHVGLLGNGGGVVGVGGEVTPRRKRCSKPPMKPVCRGRRRANSRRWPR
jgi:hypothetical protein